MINNPKLTSPFIVPCSGGYDFSGSAVIAVSDQGYVLLPDDVESRAYAYPFSAPEWGNGVKITALVVPAASGSAHILTAADAGVSGSAPNVRNVANSYTNRPLTSAVWNKDASLSFTTALEGDFVMAYINRLASDDGDTIEDTVGVYGFLVERI
jgi:hypothetical protein